MILEDLIEALDISLGNVSHILSFEFQQTVCIVSVLFGALNK